MSRSPRLALKGRSVPPSQNLPFAESPLRRIPAQHSPRKGPIPIIDDCGHKFVPFYSLKSADSSRDMARRAI